MLLGEMSLVYSYFTGSLLGKVGSEALIATAIIQSGIIVGCVVLVSTTLQFFLFSFVCLLFVRLFYLMPVWP